MRQQLIVLIVLGSLFTSTNWCMQSFSPAGATPQPPVAGLTAFNAATNMVHSKDGIRTLKILTRTEDMEMHCDERPFPRLCGAPKTTFPLTVLLAGGRQRDVIEYYANWRGPYLISDYQKSLAESLNQAAHLPYEQTQHIVAFILTKLDPSYIERVDCLLDAATDHDHQQLIQYISRVFTYPYASWALYDAVIQNNTQRLAALLSAGISPEKSIGEQDLPQVIIYDDLDFTVKESRFAHFPLHLAALRGYAQAVGLLLKHGADATRKDFYKNPPVKAAVYGFNATDTEEVTKNRLYILRKLLKAMPEDARPLPWEIGSIPVPSTVHERVLNVFRSFLPKAPELLVMLDDFTPEQIEKIKKKILLCSTVSALVCTGCCTYAHKKWCKEPKEKEQQKGVKAAPVNTAKKNVVKGKLKFKTQ